MDGDLKLKVSQLRISDAAKEALTLSGISVLEDANTYDLDNFRTILGVYAPDVVGEIKKILRKHGLPSNLKDLKLTDDVIKVLIDASIFNTFDLLTANRSNLYRLFRSEEFELAEINNVFDFYGVDALTEQDFDEHAELLRSQQDVADINLTQRIQKEVKKIRKGYGSRTYNHLKIRLASPDEIRAWSYGEVENHETINYRTAKPEEGGLFCERIFGPTKSHQCRCGKKQVSNHGQICPKCGVEITDSLVRRERMGHIELQAPVVHTWYLKNTPSRLAILLGIKAKALEEVVYYSSYIVIDPGSVPQLKKKDVLTEQGYFMLLEQFGRRFEAQTGAEAVKTLLSELDLDNEVKVLRQKFKTSTKQKRERIIRRLEVVEAFNNSDNKPQWMVMDVIPVIPPDLRPMVQLDGGRFATTDLNDLYRRIINRNARLRKEKEENAPRLVIKNEMRMLQVAVDALFDNARGGRRAAMGRDRPLKSLSDLLRGKQGRFRQNLLGKRVDYSGRSVIIVGPDLKMYQAGIPREMAIILFKPFVLRELIKNGGINRGEANRKYDRLDDDVWAALERVVQEHPVLLNRAPTLHRLGIQAFEPKLIDGKAIRLHPLVTPAFNADFDGDQMAVHVPLSPEAQAETRLLMLASNNILAPKDGKPVVTPAQDMVLGNYYLTMEDPYNPEDASTHVNRNEGRFFSTFEEANIALANDEIGHHTRIVIKPSAINKNFTEEQNNKYLVTTIGKMIFNQILPESFPYLNEASDENLFEKTPDKYFIDRGVNPKDYFASLTENDIPKPFKKGFLSAIIGQVFKRYEITETSKMLDDLKDLGFKYSTISGITVSISDMNVYADKKEILEESNQAVNDIFEQYDLGMLTDGERKKLVIQIWKNALDEIKKGVITSLDHKNNLFMMSDSRARGSIENFVQLIGMRGLMNNPKGETIEVPVQASFREGLTVSEFFISTHGARKGSTDTALKTAESGYLTRRLVDVSQDVIIVDEDCGTEKGVVLEEIVVEGDKNMKVDLDTRIIGRFSSKDIVHPKTKEIIVRRNELINGDIADEIIKAGITKVEIRSNLTCDSANGVCAKCYGLNLATNKPVEVGEAVGVVAAQSIGEPGTQLTMRTFHTGGVASGSDITAGLPRVQELFEARNPKGKAVISEYRGKVKSINTNSRSGIQTVVITDFRGIEHSYQVDPNIDLLVKEKDLVAPGSKITQGSINPKELLRVVSVEAAHKYILEEVQKVYRKQDVGINDKHIELIIRQMTRRILVVTEGDTNLLPGLEVSIHEFKAENLKALKEGRRPAVGRPILLGITRASLRSDSFLSAASFQETTRILADAAIRGKIDELHGLKENVIIGGLIPAGTGILNEKDFHYTREPIETPEEESLRESFERLQKIFNR